MNSPSPADTVSSRRLFSVFMGWWQTGREVPRQPAATDSGKLDWKCSSYPSLGRRFPSSLPPFALYPTFHPPPSPLCNVTSQEEASRGSFVPTILPPWNDPFWHTDPILTRPITVPPISNNADLLYSCRPTSFSKHVFLVPRDRVSR